MGPRASVLDPQRGSLLLPLVLAAFGHLAFGLTMFGLSFLQPKKREPLIDVMEVSMVVKPRSESKMPTRASKAPVPKGAPAAPTPKAPPPPNESDLAIHKPDAPKAQGAPDRTSERDAAIRKLLMEQLVDDAAPEGEVDRQATDPDSTTDESINAAGVGGRADPELARYEAKIQALFKPHFRPLPTITATNPDIFAIVQLDVDLETGRIRDYWVETSSGNASYDAAAERAVAAVGQIPPPPEKYRARYQSGYGIRFVPP